MKKWISISLICLLAAFASSACDEFLLGSARDNVQKTFRVEQGGNLFLDSDSGSVEVTSEGIDEVRVTVDREARGATEAEAEQTLKQQRIDFRQDGKDVYIQARRPGGSFFGNSWGNRLQLRFVILVPGRYNLDLKTGGGSIRVNDLEGTVLARTLGGSLHFGQIKGSVNGHTSGGSITLEGGSGPLDVDTSGGSIRIGKVYGPVKAHTSGGSISVDEVQGTIEASTSGGSVNATITRQPEGDCELRTSGGSIRARLRPDLDLNLQAETMGGTVQTDIPVTVQGKISRNRLEAKMNHGGPRLLLHTLGGSISINEMP